MRSGFARNIEFALQMCYNEKKRKLQMCNSLIFNVAWGGLEPPTFRTDALTFIFYLFFLLHPINTSLSTFPLIGPLLPMFLTTSPALEQIFYQDTLHYAALQKVSCVWLTWSCRNCVPQISY